jgi:hypothetical protein
MANRRVSLAFKRLNVEQLSKDKLSYRPLSTELAILGHPVICGHPNILELQGVCWDITKGGEIWPVLVFPKSTLGDLAAFMRHHMRPTFNQKLELCADIGTAVAAFHSSGKKSTSSHLLGLS